MLGFVTLGTNDVERAGRFYDALLGVLGARRGLQIEGFISWAMPGNKPALDGGNAPSLAVISPFDQRAATVGNGVMVALVANGPAQVDEMYRIAMEFGALDEGAPGARGDGSFYGCYFRDPDGNKLSVFHVSQPGS